MPIYEYACAKCEREFEVEQRITEDPLKTCPHCRSRRVKRLISNTSFVLKGSGWYSDLYSSAKDEGAGDKGDDGKGENAKGEEKPESKDSKKAETKKGDSKSGSKSKKKAGKKGSKKSAA